MESDRVAWIDDVKGIGIILVVIGHALDVYRPSHIDYVYMFEMPLFFFMAGVVFRPAPFGQYLGRRVRTLLIPAAAFLLLLVIAKEGLQWVHGAPLEGVLDGDLDDIGTFLYGGRMLTGDYGIMWFVTCLFLALLAYDGLRRQLGKPWSLRFIVVMACIFVLAYPVGPMSSPWDAAVAPMALVFVWAGDLWSNLLTTTAAPDGKGRRADNALMMSAAVVLVAVGLLYAKPFDMKEGIYGTPVLTCLVAMGCTHLVVVGCLKLSRSSLFNAVFARIGRASLVIMFLHRSLILHLRAHAPGLLTVTIALAVPFLAYAGLRRGPFRVRQIFLGERPRFGPFVPPPVNDPNAPHA